MMNPGNYIDLLCSQERRQDDRICHPANMLPCYPVDILSRYKSLAVAQCTEKNIFSFPGTPSIPSI